MPKLDPVEKQKSLDGANRLRADAKIEDLKAEQARLRGRDQALGTEPRMFGGFKVHSLNERADDALKQVTLIGPGGKTSGQPFRYES